MAEEFEQVVQVLKDFGTSTVAAIQKKIDEKKISASGNLRQSLNYKVSITEIYVKFTLDFGKADYAYFIDKGRLPTKGGGTGAVKKNLAGLTGWISHKGIKIPTQYRSTWTLKDGTVKTKMVDYKASNGLSAIAKGNRSLAFLISRKVHEKGFKARPFYSEVVTTQLIDQLKKDIRTAAKKDILIQIRKAF